MNWGPGETKSPSDPKALTPTVSLCWPKSNYVDADIRPGNDDHLSGEGNGKNGKTGNDSGMQCLKAKTRTRSSPLSVVPCCGFQVPSNRGDPPTEVPDVTVQKSESGSHTSSELTIETRDDGFFSFVQRMIRYSDTPALGERTVSNRRMTNTESEAINPQVSDEESMNALSVDNEFDEIQEAIRIVKMHASRLGVSEELLVKMMIASEREGNNVSKFEKWTDVLFD